MYQQAPEQRSKHNSSSEHNSPISIAKLRWIRGAKEEAALKS